MEKEHQSISVTTQKAYEPQSLSQKGITEEKQNYEASIILVIEIFESFCLPNTECSISTLAQKTNLLQI